MSEKKFVENYKDCESTSNESTLLMESKDKFSISPTLETKSPDKFTIFEEWLKMNGAKFPKLVLQDYGNEVRGCHAVCPIREDEIIVDIPLNCLITVEMGKDTEIGKLLTMSDIDLDAPKHIFLMIYMLIDRKKPDSFFKPYYDILPPTLHNMPIFWGPEELKYLEGSYLLQQIDERNAAIESDYLSICSLAPSFRNVCNLEEFKWARMCVCSRNFGLIVNGVRTAALVPYADMLNHYRPRETKWQFEDSSQSFTITTLQSIVAGAQVYDSYGQKCNHRFLLNYGFSVERNVEPDGSCPNEVPILLELKKDDPLYEQKMTFWRRDSASSARRLRIAVCDNENSRNMMALLRVIESDRNEFEKLISSGESNSGYRSIRNAHVPVSTRLEFKVLIKLNELISQYLAAYPTTYDDDCKRLESPDGPVLFSNERHALIQVKGEKEILLFYKEFTETGIRLLQIKDNNWIEYDAIMNQVRNSKHSIVYQYCRNVIHRLRCDEQRRNEIRQKSVDFSRPTIV